MEERWKERCKIGRRGIKRNPCMIENASFLWSCDGRTSTVEHRLEDHSVMAEFLAQADPLERENMFLEWRWCTLLLGIYLYERERERRTARKRSKIEISRRTWRWFFRDLERKNGVVRCKEREGKNLSPPWHCWWRWNIESKCRVMIYLLLARTKKGEERKLNSIIFNVKIILIRFLSFSLPPIFDKERLAYLIVTSQWKKRKRKKAVYKNPYD